MQLEKNMKRNNYIKKWVRLLNIKTYLGKKYILHSSYCITRLSKYNIYLWETVKILLDDGKSSQRDL